MLVYLWGVGHQERQQRQTDSYGRTPWSGSVWASPGALGRLRRAARRWRNGAGTLAEWCRNAGGALGGPGVLQESLASGRLVLALGLSKIVADVPLLFASSHVSPYAIISNSRKQMMSIKSQITSILNIFARICHRCHSIHLYCVYQLV